MTFLPIVGRELRVAARRRGTHWLRLLTALAVIIGAGWIFLAAHEESPRAIGQVIFYVLTGAALLYCLLAGLRSTADCLSEEKREGTLGLLFLTDLRGYDVVIGKLAANSLNAFYGVLAVVPVLGIPLLLGGVTVGEFGRVALVLVNTLWFSMCVGMFASAMSKSARKAIGLTFFLLLFFTAGVPALGAWVAWVFKARMVDLIFLKTSVVYCYAMAQDRPFVTTPQEFYWSVGVIHGLGWVFLTLASLVTPRAWQDRPAGAAGVRWRERWQYWSHGDTAERQSFRDRLLDRNAFFWLATRPRSRPVWVWCVLALAGVAWLWGYLKLQNDWLNEGIYIATALLLNSVLKSWLAAEAGRQLIEDRKLGALELLLSTPLPVREILRGQRLALQRQFLAPVLVVLGAELVMLVAGAGSANVGDDGRSAWVGMWLAGMLMLVLDLVALYWVGMWVGMSARNPKHAFSGVIVRILILPWVAYAVVMTLVALAPSDLQNNVSWGFFLGVWFGLGLLADVGFSLWARQKLLSDFRVVATQRFQRRASWWQRLWGKAPVVEGDAGH